MKLDQVIQALDITMEFGKNFDKIIRGPNVWPLIIDRETAIKALQYGCEKGPPFIVVRTVHRAFTHQDGYEHPRQVWYEVGNTGHEQDMGFEMPGGISGFPKNICIDAELAETLVAEGILWMRGDVDQEQIHCYYTGAGSYYEKHKATLVPHAEKHIAQRRAEILANHVKARIRESVTVDDTDELLDRVRKGYEECSLLLPADDAIRAEIERVLGATPILLAKLAVGGQFVHANAPYQVKAPDGNYYHVGPTGSHGIECRLPLDTNVVPL